MPGLSMILPHLGSILNWEYGKFQLARWSHKVVLFPERTDPTWPEPTTQFSFCVNVVRCPYPNCSPHQQNMCGVPPFHYRFFLCGVPPPNVVLCLCLSILILCLSWNIILAQLVSPSVALPAELVLLDFSGCKHVRWLGHILFQKWDP